mmetsp:Transcript_1504/g.4418  ORF Transcript_1504/g.4418 Transcript_1504/m.4418 type:complete len:213 (+) Transcript_1504:2224-2862(+)
MLEPEGESLGLQLERRRVLLQFTRSAPAGPHVLRLERNGERLRRGALKLLDKPCHLLRRHSVIAVALVLGKHLVRRAARNRKAELSVHQHEGAPQVARPEDARALHIDGLEGTLDDERYPRVLVPGGLGLGLGLGKDAPQLRHESAKLLQVERLAVVLVERLQRTRRSLLGDRQPELLPDALEAPPQLRHIDGAVAVLVDCREGPPHLGRNL